MFIHEVTLIKMPRPKRFTETAQNITYIKYGFKVQHSYLAKFSVLIYRRRHSKGS